MVVCPSPLPALRLATRAGAVALAAPARADVALVNTSSDVVGGETTTLSWTHVVGSGSDRLLVVGVSIEDADETVSSVTLDPSGSAQSFTQISGARSSYDETSTELWYLVNPASGS